MRAVPLIFFLAFLIAGCGGGSDDSGDGSSPPPPGGSTIITSSNYLDAAAVAYVAAARLEFANDLIDAAFETVLNTFDIPGTYPCLYGGTVSYTRSGSVYTFTVANCDTDVGGQRITMPSGKMTVKDPVVQTTSAGYFLTSATTALTDAAFVESGAVSVGNGSANLSSTVTSSTTASATASGGTLSILRAGRTDSYTQINVTSSVTLFNGNTLTGGSFKISTPRAPGALTVSATSTSLTATAGDNSQVVLTTADRVNYKIEYVVGIVVEATITGNAESGEFAEAIARALE